jgi:hypothetical protein
MVQAPSLPQFPIVMLAAWLARQHEAFIDYLKTENRILTTRLGAAPPQRHRAPRAFQA